MQRNDCFGKPSHLASQRRHAEFVRLLSDYDRFCSTFPFFRRDPVYQENSQEHCAEGLESCPAGPWNINGLGKFPRVEWLLWH